MLGSKSVHDTGMLCGDDPSFKISPFISIIMSFFGIVSFTW